MSCDHEVNNEVSKQWCAGGTAGLWTVTCWEKTRLDSGVCAYVNKEVSGQWHANKKEIVASIRLRIH